MAAPWWLLRAPSQGRFYVEFLGCTLDFGGPADGVSGPFYGQVSRGASTFHLTETPYVASPGATVGITIGNLDELYRELDRQRTSVEVWGPAVWVPAPEEVPWGMRLMTISDPFGNHLRFSQPLEDKNLGLPRW